MAEETKSNPLDNDLQESVPPSPQLEEQGGTNPEREKELQEARVEIDRLKDQLLRKAAEFENFKRRNEAEWQNFQRLANERILLSFLPILDDFSRSLKSGKENTGHEAFYQGVEMIYNKFLQAMKAQGVETLDAVGKPFNVEEHDALLQVDRPDLPDHVVVEEVEKGYRLNDKVLRHAKVIVSGSGAREGSNE
ncbi:MAG: nucleotide exchange factor GrpE [Bacteroidota bacterium]